MTTKEYVSQLHHVGFLVNSSAKADCTLILIEFKILVPKAIWGAIAITTRVFDAKELTLSALVAVVDGDVAFLIAGRF